MVELSQEEAARFRDRYAVSGQEAMLATEMAALGSDYQANGYTTMEQANRMGDFLVLGPGNTLLDVGAGCGWPGLYLARRHGCEVLSLDPIQQGSEVALARAALDGLEERAWAVRGSGEALPLRSSSVDGVIHTDVLC